MAAGTVQEVVPSVMFSCSGAAAWVTGAILVDGGLLAGNGAMAAEILGAG